MDASPWPADEGGKLRLARDDRCGMGGRPAIRRVAPMIARDDLTAARQGCSGDRLVRIFRLIRIEPVG